MLNFEDITKIIGDDGSNIICYDSFNPYVRRDFLNYCLKESVEYDLRVGYFDSKWFKDHAIGMAHFAKNNGKARWIISPKIRPNDPIVSAVNDIDNEQTEKLIEKDIEELIEDFKNDKHLIDSLAILLKTKRIEIKVGIKRQGIMHEKTGIFRDIDGKIVTHVGSENTTGAASEQSNDTTIEMSCDNIARCKKLQAVFDKRWNHEEPEIKHFNLSKRLIDKIIDFASEGNDPDVFYDNYDYDKLINTLNEDIIEKIFHEGFFIPTKYTAKENFNLIQNKAIEETKNKDFSCILSMATGSGKTITSIKIFQQFLELKKSKPLAIVFCPSELLVRQWENDFKECKIFPTIYPNSQEKNRSNLSNYLDLLDDDMGEFEVVICTHEFLMDKMILNRLIELKENLFVIVDEVHRIFSTINKYKGIKETFFNKIKYKIGLTATPEKRYKPDPIFENAQVELIEDFFGDDSLLRIVDLNEAINKYKILCPYDYHLTNFHMTYDETEEIFDLYKKAIKSHKDDSDESAIHDSNSAIHNLTRTINGIGSKILCLKSFMNEKFCKELIKNDELSIFFISPSHIESLSEHFEAKKIRASKITYETEKARRIEILENLQKKRIQAVIAFTILDEGINVPAINNAFFTEQYREPRQGIQRRGRVLRLDEKNPSKIAKIYDFKTLLNNDFISEQEKINNNSMYKAFLNYVNNKEDERVDQFSSDSRKTICYNFNSKMNKFDSFEITNNEKESNKD